MPRRRQSIRPQQLVRFITAVLLRLARNVRHGGNLVLTRLLAAAAAKINAQLQARRAAQHADAAPTRTPASPARPTGSNSAGTVNGEMYIADGDYIKDIEVNDLRNRYLLTKGSTQKMVNNCPWIIPADPSQTV